MVRRDGRVFLYDGMGHRDGLIYLSDGRGCHDVLNDGTSRYDAPGAQIDGMGHRDDLTCCLIDDMGRLDVPDAGTDRPSAGAGDSKRSMDLGGVA
jgi:hypothetical protein